MLYFTSHLNVSTTPAGRPSQRDGTIWGQGDYLFLDVLVSKGVNSKDRALIHHGSVGLAFEFGFKEMSPSPLSLLDVMDG